MLRKRRWAMQIPSNLLSIKFSSWFISIHEFYFEALNKSNYCLPLLCVTHLEHVTSTDSSCHSVEVCQKALSKLCPLIQPEHMQSSAVSIPNYVGVIGCLRWVSVRSWGDVSGDKGPDGYTVPVKDINRSKSWGKRRSVLGDELGMMLDTGKDRCR